MDNKQMIQKLVEGVDVVCNGKTHRVQFSPLSAALMVALDPKEKVMKTIGLLSGRADE